MAAANLEACATRTFSVEHRRVPDDWFNSDAKGLSYVVRAEPLERSMPDGSTRISVGFPLLAITDWTGGADGIAALVARLLTEHYAKAEGR